MNKSNKKGFTLAELLIVVAIIAVLVAIAIPVFTSQLEKSREAVDLANLRAAYAECAAEVIGSDNTESTRTVEITQVTAGFQDQNAKIGKTLVKDDAVLPTVKKGDTVTVKVTADGTLSFTK